MPFANVHISKGSKTLYRWYIYPIPYEMTLREFFYKIIDKIPYNALIDVEQIKKIELSKLINSSTNTLQASPDCNIIELMNEFRRNVHYCLSTNELQPHNSHNALDIIMQSAQNRQLYASIFNGWSTQILADNKGKQFIIALSDALWYVDMRNRTKLQQQNFHIPQLFLEFLDRVNPEAYKEARP
ncbi:3797_t:CDS:2 [Gigaspora margarita]|uniref:3797_t:CDS:1 n=1 Tax=Gigaspora margarita TaxID=4874 RepID=A0ABN7UE60_GIGMA|nr:3797_t:CDS:2 [Gigaspora margarita]